MNNIKIIDFSAEWCPSCKVFMPTLESTSKEMGLELIKVDTDENPRLTSDMGVMSLPTIVLMKDGQELARNTGLMSKQKLIEFLKNNIN